MIIAIISAFFFAVQHTYSGIYIIVTFFSGLVYAYSFLVYIEKRVSALLVVMGIHGLRNFITFIFLHIN